MSCLPVWWRLRQQLLLCHKFLRVHNRRADDRQTIRFFIYNDGDVSSDIWIVVDSYGINTSYMTDDDAFLVESYGIIHNDYDISQTHNSYGFL